MSDNDVAFDLVRGVNCLGGCTPDKARFKNNVCVPLFCGNER